jgi:hypothetical protein
VRLLTSISVLSLDSLRRAWRIGVRGLIFTAREFDSLRADETGRDSRVPTTLKWKIFTQIGRTIASPSDVSTIAFNASPSPGQFSQFALPLGHSYIPLALTPTATYHQILKNRLEGAGFALSSKKMPYMLDVPAMGKAPSKHTSRRWKD